MASMGVGRRTQISHTRGMASTMMSEEYRYIMDIYQRYYHPPPILSNPSSSSTLSDHSGTSLRIKQLGSCQDLNYQIYDLYRQQKYLLKIFSPTVTTLNDVKYQIQCLLYLQNINQSQPFSTDGITPLQFPVPQLTMTSKQYYETTIYDNQECYICLLSYLEGRPLSSFYHYSPQFQQQYGRIVANICSALSHYEPEWNRGYGQWDMRKVIDEITRLQPLVTSLAESDVEQLQQVLTSAGPVLDKYRGMLREQVIHGDLATYNIIARRNAQFQPDVTGIIDFGDCGTSWTVSEIVVAILSSLWHLRNHDDCFLQAFRIVEEFHAHFPLTLPELTCIWPLLLLRSVHILYTVSYELQLNPTNDYNQQQMIMEWKVFRLIREVDLQMAMNAFESLVTPLPDVDVELSSLFRDFPDMPANVLDFSPKSALFIEGNWLSEALASNLQQIIGQTGSLPVSLYGETKFYKTEIPLSHKPSTISLFTEFYLSPNTKIFAPFDCDLWYNNQKNAVILHNENDVTFFLRGVTLDEQLFVGPFPRKITISECIGVLSSQPYSIDYSSSLLFPPRLTVQVGLEKDTFPKLPPLFCTSDMFPHWNRLYPSPNYFFPRLADLMTTSSRTNIFEALRKRQNCVAAVQEHYFQNPPLIIRGWKEYLYDDTGRGYLDMVNNVTVLGHCHPAVTAAATSQLNLLNTNSRFIYSELGEFAEMIVSTLPPESKLTKVLFVNSGSEATDLALRIARTVVSEQRQQNRMNNISPMYPRPIDGLHRDTICMEGGYHGITTASDEVSTTLNDNPIALESRPPWIHLVPMPNKFRGKFEGENSLDKYVDAVRNKITTLSDAGTPVSVFIAEPLSGNAGGVELPPGYLQQVYAAVHEAGGLCISDEVQVGYGRLGTTFWGFQEHGVIPDIITMAKAAGNGYPLGFVVTTEEIIEKFRIVGSFFSSAGGGPLSCRIGKCILQQIMTEKLQENAVQVGNYFTSLLHDLSRKYPHIIGCIHGHGLYQGVEIIQPPPKYSSSSTLPAEKSSSRNIEPGTQEAYQICRNLLELGVICHNTGDYSNVLKIKPPLCITEQGAKFFVENLEVAIKMLNC